MSANNVQKHLYYDLSVVNTSNDLLPLSFKEDRSMSFIKNASEWYMTPIKFQIDTAGTAPLMIPLIDFSPSNTNVNKTAYTFTMTYMVGSTEIMNQENVIYVPENKNINPPPYVSVNYAESEYYFIMSFQTFVDSLNVCLTNCWNNLKTKVIAAGGVMPGAAPNIYFDFDVLNCLPNLCADVLQYNDTDPTKIKVYCNTKLHPLLSSLQFNTYPVNAADGKEAQIRIYPMPNNSNIIQFDSYNALVSYSAYSVAGLWTIISSIVITTQIIPTCNTLVSPTKLSGSSLSSTLSGNPQISQVIDFDCQNGYDIVSGGSVSYIANGQYRLIDLVNESPLSSVDLQFFYKTKFGKLIPMKLHPTAHASILLMFRHKSLGI
jgi:hypothetical protein